MAFEPPDREHVDSLRKSARTIGFLTDVVVNKQNRNDVLSGRHRKSADPDWPEREQEVKSDLHRELIILHGNVQRSIPDKVTKNRLLRIARILATTGGAVSGIDGDRMIEPVARERVCERMTDPEDPLVPFSPQWVRRCLPDEYKRKEHAVRSKDVLRNKFLKSRGPAIPRDILDLNRVVYPAEDCLCSKCAGHQVCYGCAASNH